MGVCQIEIEGLSPGANPIKLFRVNLLTHFCKLDHFTTVKKSHNALKRFELQIKVKKSTLKMFYEIRQFCNVNYGRKLQIFVIS